jgi:hypothetical protein
MPKIFHLRFQSWNNPLSPAMAETAQLDIEANNNTLSGKAQFTTGNKIGNWLHLPHIRRGTIILILFGLLSITALVVGVGVGVGTKSQEKLV